MAKGNPMPILGGVPSKEDEELHGVLQAIDTCPREVADGDLEFMAYILDHWPTRLTRRMRERIEKLKETYLT